MKKEPGFRAGHAPVEGPGLPVCRYGIFYWGERNSGGKGSSGSGCGTTSGLGAVGTGSSSGGFGWISGLGPGAGTSEGVRVGFFLSGCIMHILEAGGGFGFGLRMRGNGSGGLFIPLIERAIEPFAVLRMGDVDQQLGALFQIFSKEVYLAVFRDDPVDVAAGGHDAGAFFEEGDDAGDAG